MRKTLIFLLSLVLVLLTMTAAYAGSTGIWYTVTIPSRGSVTILNDTKSRSSSYDYFCVSLDDGTASSVIASSSYGGSMKVYKNEGYCKIYYDTVPATNSSVSLYVYQGSLFNQTAKGYSYVN